MVAGNNLQILIDYSKRKDLNEQSTTSLSSSSSASFDLKFIIKRLRLKGWKITINKDALTDDVLNKHNVLIIFMPQLKFTDYEFGSIKQFLENNNGRILIMLEEDGERKSSTNINYFIEEYGTSVNNDKVIRTSFYKYYNPKEVLIQDGVLNRSLISHANDLNLFSIQNNETAVNTVTTTNSSNKISILYPFGATLNVTKPSIAVLSTGKTSFPPCRPICSFYEHNVDNEKNGRMIVIGSGHMFIDKYIHKENNIIIFEIFMDYLIDKQFKLNQIDSLNPEINDYHFVPDLQLLCDNPMLYMEESEELPLDYTTLFSRKIYKISNQSLALINDAYQELQIEKNTLQMIRPLFETPLPALQPAYYMPIFRSHTKPELELFDLDNEFSSVHSKLAKLANKCNNSDLDYFIIESGYILGLDITKIQGKNDNDKQQLCKQILFMIMKKIIAFKKINNDD